MGGNVGNLHNKQSNCFKGPSTKEGKMALTAGYLKNKDARAKRFAANKTEKQESFGGGPGEKSSGRTRDREIKEELKGNKRVTRVEDLKKEKNSLKKRPYM